MFLAHAVGATTLGIPKALRISFLKTSVAPDRQISTISIPSGSDSHKWSLYNIRLVVMKHYFAKFTFSPTTNILPGEYRA